MIMMIMMNMVNMINYKSMMITCFSGVAKEGKRINPMAGTIKAKAVFTCNHNHNDHDDDHDHDDHVHDGDLLHGETGRSMGGNCPV